MAAGSASFDLDRAMARFDVVAVLRVTDLERLPPPMLATNATGRVVVPLKGDPGAGPLRFTTMDDFWFPQRGSECLCALQRTGGEPSLVLRDWAPADVVARTDGASEALLAWAAAQLAPVPCARCDAPLRVRNRSGLAREVMSGLVFCPQHVPGLSVHVAEVVLGTFGEGPPQDVPTRGVPSGPGTPGLRFAVDIGLARRGVFPDPGAPFVSYEIDGEGRRSAVGLLPMATFTDGRGEPRKRSRRCPQCGATYGSVRPLGICPSCGKKHLADLPELLD